MVNKQLIKDTVVFCNLLICVKWHNGKQVNTSGQIIWPNIPSLGYRKHFILAYPQPLPGSEICQNKTMSVLMKNALKKTKR